MSARPPAAGARSAVVATVLSFLLPGLGHAFLGERRRGAGFLALVGLSFAVGLALDGRLPRPVPGHPLEVAATVTAASTGVLFAGAKLSGLGSGDPTSATFELGNGYILTAGTMSLLLVVDLIARGARRRK